MAEPHNSVEPEILQPKPIIRSTEELRDLVTRTLLGCFGVSVVLTDFIIVGYGFGWLRYPDSFLHWLGAATVGQTASLLGIVVKFLFPQTPATKRKKELDASNK
jgi:hypothetical protein